MVFQDGLGFMSTNGSWRVPVVFDNLIAAKEMPVTIAVLLNPGMRAEQSNRSFEYDSLGDAYARFLLRACFKNAELSTLTLLYKLFEYYRWNGCKRIQAIVIQQV